MSTFEDLSFYRGVSTRYPTDRPSLHWIRRDRRPRNSSTQFHDAADEWFLKKFGVPYRSQGLFVTSRIFSATHYGASPDHVMRIVPLSAYRFCWSPNTTDLLFLANRLASAPIDEIEDQLNRLTYIETDLHWAQELGHEVMLHCERYIAIPVAALREAEPATGPSIILPT